MLKTLNMIEKIKCQKIDKYFFKSPEGKLKNIYNTVEERTVKPKVHTITKI